MQEVAPNGIRLYCRLESAVRSADEGLVCHRRFEAYNRFTRPGIAEALTGKPLDGFGVVLQRFDLCAQLPCLLLFLLKLRIEAQDLLSHALILFDERQIPDRYSQEAREKQQEHD